MKRKYNYKNLIKRGFIYINKAVENKYYLKQISSDLRELVNSYSGLNRNERYWLYEELYTLARKAKSSGEKWQETLSRRSNYDAVLSTARKVKRNSELRAKRQALYEAMHTEGVIFFLCSYHNNPADDHKDYQGHIFVDKFYRTKVPGRLYYAVNSYIKNHNIQTVQEIMGPPVYLCVRPYCKHYFIGLDTSTVLHNSRSKLVKEYGTTKEVLYTEDEYYDLRSKVYEQLDKRSPCKAYKNKIKIRG